MELSVGKFAHKPDHKAVSSYELKTKVRAYQYLMNEK